jgi:hypothetical protein
MVHLIHTLTHFKESVSLSPMEDIPTMHLKDPLGTSPLYLLLAL